MNTIECPFGHVRIDNEHKGCPYCALHQARACFELAYDAIMKGFSDEALLHCGYGQAQIEKIIGREADNPKTAKGE